MTRRNLALNVSRGDDTPRPIASWYTEGTSDGVGDRLLMFDNSGTPSLELLRFRRELAAVSGFEEALRQRVGRLDAFVHPAFPQVRAVDRLEGGGLALVSTFTTGRRLSEVFRTTSRSGVQLTFAARVIKDVTSAMADLQKQGPGIAHGGLTPDRIVLTPDGRLVITEHVLGAALERLQLPVNRLWQDLGVLAPENGGGAARLDCRTDVIQLGWMVLSMLLGRRIAPAENSRHLGALLDEFVHVSGSRSPALVSALRRWLERALQVAGDSFESAVDADAATGDLGMHVIFSTRRHTIEQFAHHTSQPLPPAPPETSRALEPPPHSPSAGPASVAISSERHTMAAATQYIDDARPPEIRRDLRPAVSSDQPANSGVENAVRAGLNWAVIAAFAFASVAAVEGAVIGRLAFGARAQTGIPIVFDSLEPGDAVVVDGRQIGVTPLATTLTPDMRSVRVRSRAALAALDIKPVQVLPVSDHPADDPALAQARGRRGGLRLTSPIEVQVLEGEHVLGSSADGVIVTTAGRHEVDFVNTLFGYRSRQVLDIKAGQIMKITVAPPNGRVSVNAVPWAQVWINGSSVGETPLANLPLPVGEHQITFRHPQLGEQKQKFVVKANGVTRVSASFSR